MLSQGRREPQGYVSRGGLWKDLQRSVCGLKDVLRPHHPELAQPADPGPAYRPHTR